MSGVRDYEQWHENYDDPSSSLSWRLGVVQRHIEQALDRSGRPIRVLSACSGDGRDVLQVLARRDDAHRVTATLIEIHPGIAEHAREGAAGTSARVEVRTEDAGDSAAYLGIVPADLVLLVGVFGNITNKDVHTTVRTAPQLCQPGATLIWSRGRDDGDRNHDIRAWFTAAGFTELDYATLETGSRPAVGVVRYDGPPQPLVAGRRLFTFVR
jgi:hypothetical protein